MLARYLPRRCICIAAFSLKRILKYVTLSTVSTVPACWTNKTFVLGTGWRSYAVISYSSPSPIGSFPGDLSSAYTGRGVEVGWFHSKLCQTQSYPLKWDDSSHNPTPLWVVDLFSRTIMIVLLHATPSPEWCENLWVQALSQSLCFLWKDGGIFVIHGLFSHIYELTVEGLKSLHSQESPVSPTAAVSDSNRQPTLWSTPCNCCI